MITLRQTPKQRVHKHSLSYSQREKPADANGPVEINYVEKNALLCFVGLNEEDAAGFVAQYCLSKHYY